MRIVSPPPGLPGLCCALGLDPERAGGTHERFSPPAARAKPHATRSVLPPGLTDSAEIDRLVSERLLEGLPIYELDVELLERIGPDLILTQELCEVCAVSYTDVLAAAQQLSSQPDVVSIEPNTLDDVLTSIQTIGRLTGRAVTAAAVVEALRHRLDWISERIVTTHASPRRVVCLEWLDPPMVAGHWVPEMVRRAGGVDLLGRAGEPSFRVGWDDVRAAEPDVLVLMPCGYDLPQTVREAERLGNVPGIDQLPAARSRQVYAVDGSGYFNRPGPRLIGGVEILAGILHPEAFAGVTRAGAVQPVQIRAVEPSR